MITNSIYNHGQVISRSAEHGIDSFIEGENVVKEISDKSKIVLVLEDKSISSTLSVISTLRADRHLILLDSRLAKRQLDTILDLFDPEIILGSKESMEICNFKETKQCKFFNIYKRPSHSKLRLQLMLIILAYLDIDEI